MRWPSFFQQTLTEYLPSTAPHRILANKTNMVSPVGSLEPHGENNINKELNNSVVDTWLGKYKANFICYHLWKSKMKSGLFTTPWTQSNPQSTLFIPLYRVYSSQAVTACLWTCQEHARHGGRRGWTKYEKSKWACSALQWRQLYICPPSLNSQLLKNRDHITQPSFYCLQNVFPVVCKR